MSALGKLVGTVIKDRIIRYTAEQSLLKEHHHSFCIGKSCLTNHLEFFEKMTGKETMVTQKTLYTYTFKRLLTSYLTKDS